MTSRPNNPGAAVSGENGRPPGFRRHAGATDLLLLVIRAALGLSFLLDGATRLLVPGRLRALVHDPGLLEQPWAGPLAAVSTGWEVAIGIGCLVGLATRLAGGLALLALVADAALGWIAASPLGMLFGSETATPGGALIVVAGSLVLAFAGGGAYSVDALRGRHSARKVLARRRLSGLAIGLLAVNLVAGGVLAAQLGERRLREAAAFQRILIACGDALEPAATSNPRPGVTAPAAPLDQGGAGTPNIVLERLADVEQPVYITHAGDGSERLFVVSRQGRVSILRDGVVSPAPFLDISHLVSTGGFEQGLLSVAFHPRFAENGRFYVNYIDRVGIGNTVVARYQVSTDNPDQADPQSATKLLYVEQPYQNHNGGQLRFGPDGYLYVGMGDGGSAGDPRGNAQNKAVLLGKLLRIDVDQGEPYGIPPDNPFVDDAGARPEVWAYGLRNPWRFAFDRASGDLYLADVGQDAWEWVHLQPAGVGGQNYGWSCVEGSHCYPAGRACDRTRFIPPVAEYSHRLGCSITGGHVYRGARFPQLRGLYLYGDFCSGRIWMFARQPSGESVSVELLDSDLAISSFGEDEDGELHVADLRGSIYRIVSQP